MIIKIILWLILWFGVQGFTNIVLKKRGYTYTQKPLYTFITFLFGIILSYISFKEELTDILLCYPLCLVLPTTAILVSFVIYFFLKKCTKQQDGIESSEFSQIKYSFLVFKTTDVIFQDLLLLVILFLFRQYFPINLHFILLFNLFFVFIHLPILIFRKSNDSLAIVLGSIFLGLLLPLIYLIPNFNFAHIFILHWSFYILGGISYRLLPPFRKFLLSRKV